jgi:hypothetical protein
LTIQRIVGVCGVYNFPKKDKRLHRGVLPLLSPCRRAQR